MSNRGFKGFRAPQQISDEALEAALKRMGVEGRYIFWTGNAYRGRTQSLRFNSLACCDVKRRPVSLMTWLKKAARVVSADQGYTPERVREGLYLHRGQKPSVYFELEKDKDGNYRSVNDVPNADGFPKGLKRGDIVVAAKVEGEQKALPSKGKQKPQAPAPQPEAETVTA